MIPKKINTEKTSKASSGILQWLLIFTTIFLFLAVMGFIGILLFENSYANRIFPGVFIGNIDVGGKTAKEALAILNQKNDEISKDGITFYSGEKKVIVPVEIFGSDPDLSRVIISLDVKRAADEAYSYGRNSYAIQNLVSQASVLLNKKYLSIPFTINEKQVLGILKNGFKDMEDPGRDALLQISGAAINILKEQEGRVFDYQSGILAMQENLASIKNDPIELRYIYIYPKITMDEAWTAVPLVEEAIQTTTPKILYNSMLWDIKREQSSDWLEFAVLGKDAAGDKKRIGIRFNRDKVIAFLQGISDTINIEPVEAKFELIDSRVTKFQASKNGRKINYELTYTKINREFFYFGNSTVEIIVDSLPPAVSTEDINNLGIKEQIGTGITSFAGSPRNRRLNIANGAKLLNGLLIKPNEEFSLLQALKPFDSTNGFLPELVIKGDRTIPEYGGGLCQIATTLFRAILNTGLPITERKNHSYRVSYYEPPAGIDATIYEPSPDFKFINDTPGHILLIAEIDKDNLIFKLYGTSDGRKAEIVPEKPKIYNITSPGEPRYIETDEIPPGEKKLVEKPHNGADTEFDYVVTYSNGTVKQVTYKSHYVAWKETWLVGKTPTSTAEIAPDGVILFDEQKNTP